MAVFDTFWIHNYAGICLCCWRYFKNILTPVICSGKAFPGVTPRTLSTY